MVALLAQVLVNKTGDGLGADEGVEPRVRGQEAVDHERAQFVSQPGGHRHLEAYFERLLARPSFARAVDEARPFRSLFPLGWPDSYG